LQRSLSDLPVGIASMTDRSLPNLMPTVDETVFARTMHQSVAIDRPPPSQPHPKGRATSFEAIVPLVESRFYSPTVQRRLLVVFTDGESAGLSQVSRLTLQRRVTPVFVHVWAPDERIFRGDGSADPGYRADPSSVTALATVASITHGEAFTEAQFDSVVRASRDAVGRAQAHTLVAGYARIPLAPWLILAAAAPLAFLLWRRNA